MKTISSEKRALILSLLCEGNPVNAVCRILHTGKHTVLRVIRETGEALADYSDKTFRNLYCSRVAMDEQWQFVGKHGQRMARRELERGDFWLWAAIDSDSKLIFSTKIGRRDRFTCEDFVRDAASRVLGTVQVTSDALGSYARHIPTHFKQNGASYATEEKSFSTQYIPALFPATRRHGIEKIVAAKREAHMGQPDLRTASTSAIERFFLTMRQELKRYQRLGLGYSKDLAMHKAATALQIGIYNLVRKHSALDGKTPAQAAGVESKRWKLEEVVALAEAFHAPRKAATAAEKAIAKRAKEDAVFLAALAQSEI